MPRQINLDCWIDRFEFENHKYGYTKCYFLCNDIQQINTTAQGI